MTLGPPLLPGLGAGGAVSAPHCDVHLCLAAWGHLGLRLLLLARAGHQGHEAPVPPLVGVVLAVRRTRININLLFLESQWGLGKKRFRSLFTLVGPEAGLQPAPGNRQVEAVTSTARSDQ